MPKPKTEKDLERKEATLAEPAPVMNYCKGMIIHGGVRQSGCDNEVFKDLEWCAMHANDDELKAALTTTCDGDHEGLSDYGAFIVGPDNAWAWVSLPVEKHGPLPLPIRMVHCFLCGSKLEIGE